MINKIQTTFSRNLRKNYTDAEKLLWYKLRNRQLDGIKFRRQQSIGSFVVDFVSFEYKIIIELDGGQHNDKTVKTYDERRTEFFQKEGFNVLRFWNNDVLTNINGVLEKVLSEVKKIKYHPSP